MMIVRIGSITVRASPSYSTSGDAFAVDYGSDKESHASLLVLLHNLLNLLKTRCAITLNLILVVDCL